MDVATVIAGLPRGERLEILLRLRISGPKGLSIRRG